MIRLILAVLIAVLYLILTLPVLGILYLIKRKDPLKANRIGFRMVTWVLNLIGHASGAKVEVKGLENVPTDQPVLYIGNHNSIFDIILSYPLLPNLTGFIAKKELNKVPILGWWLKLLGGLFLDRDDPKQGLQTILTAIDHVKSGVSIFIFPEGTRSKDGTLGEFKAGSFKVATRTGCPIIPVAITGTADILENHFPFIKSQHVTFTFGEPILPGELTPEEKKHIGPLVQERVADMLHQS